MPGLRSLLSLAFDPSDIGLTRKATVIRGALVALAVLLLVWLLRPDLFGLIPNSLDPMFYTGYSINLDDALDAAGNRHYFVSRWTTYMPMYVCGQIFGPFWGRLILRLLLLIILSEMLWRLGRRLEINAASRLLGITVVVTTPMFVRAFTTDYPEYFIAWGGMAMILIATNPRTSRLGSFLMGLLAAALTIANPFTLFLVAVVSIAAIVLWIHTFSAREAAFRGSLALVAGAITVAFGYLLFRFHYRIGNVYEPTLDFIRTYRRPEVDPWVSPQKSWARHFGWIYLPPILAATAVLLRPRMNTASRRLVAHLLPITTLVYAYHVYFELRSGHALETSYYWSMSLPAVFLLIFVVLATQNSKPLVVTPVLIGLITLLRFGVPESLRLGAGTALLAAFAVFIVSLVLSVKWMPVAACPLIVLLLTWVQIGSPAYVNYTQGGDVNSPQYDSVYNVSALTSRLVPEETIWFSRQMDNVEHDAESTFLSAGGMAGAIVGIYIPHPFGRWILPQEGTTPLPGNVRDEVEFGYRKNLVIYGPPPDVERVRRRLKGEFSHPEILIDETNPGGLGYRLVVITTDATETARARVGLARLARQTGELLGDESVLLRVGDAPGYATFGPYLGLGSGSYVAEIEYQTVQSGSIGYFEVYNDQTQESHRIELSQEDGGRFRSTVRFTSTPESGTWQFRTYVNGQHEAKLLRITLERLETK